VHAAASMNAAMRKVDLRRSNAPETTKSMTVSTGACLPALDLSRFAREGLYVLTEGGCFMDLSHERIQRLSDSYWTDAVKLPERVRRHEHFKTCSVCPYRGQDVFCSAMKPILPFLEDLEAFKSFDKVTAVYVDKNGLTYVSRTTLQQALQYVVNLALFEYCEDAKKYARFFKGIHPFMTHEAAATVLLLNLHWLCGGDRSKMDAQLKEISDAMQVTSTSCVKRLRTLCHSDVLINSYIIAHTFSSVLAYVYEVADEYYGAAPKRIP
jgi:hypothetical protein